METFYFVGTFLSVVICVFMPRLCWSILFSHLKRSFQGWANTVHSAAAGIHVLQFILWKVYEKGWLGFEILKGLLKAEIRWEMLNKEADLFEYIKDKIFLLVVAPGNLLAQTSKPIGRTKVFHFSASAVTIWQSKETIGLNSKVLLHPYVGIAVVVFLQHIQQEFQAVF